MVGGGHRCHLGWYPLHSQVLVMADQQNVTQFMRDSEEYLAQRRQGYDEAISRLQKYREEEDPPDFIMLVLEETKHEVVEETEDKELHASEWVEDGVLNVSANKVPQWLTAITKMARMIGEMDPRGAVAFSLGEIVKRLGVDIEDIDLDNVPEFPDTKPPTLH